MAYYKKAKTRRRVRGGSAKRRYGRKGGSSRFKRDYKRARKFNRKHKIIGLDPRYMFSPFEVIPYLGQASEVQRLKAALRILEKGTDSYYERRRYGNKKSRGRRTKSSPSRRKKPRGKKDLYYYSTGKYKRNYRK